jgi:hypothetical protein
LNITISEHVFATGLYQYGGSTATLRVYVNKSFIASDGTIVPQGAVGGTGFYKEVACTITDDTLTIPSFVLPSTMDALDDQTSSYTFVLYDSKRAKRDTLFASVRGGRLILPSNLGSTLTFAQIVISNQSQQPLRDASVYTKVETNTQIELALGTLNDASTTVKGRTRLSVAPALPGSPIAVGDNDPRLAGLPVDPATTTSLGMVQLSSAPLSAATPIVVAKTDNASITNPGVVTTTTSSPIVVSTDDPRVLNAADVTAANIFTHATGQSVKKLILPGSTSGSITLQAPAVAGSVVLTLPDSAGSNGFVLQTNGEGVLSWTAQTGGGGGSSPGGATTQLQYNNAGTLGGVTGATSDGTVVTLTSPVLVTPTLGVATATSVNKVTITAPAASATLTIANTKTLTVSNTLTLAGTDSTVMTFPSTSASIARTDAAQTFTGVQTFSTAIAVTSGGTGTGTAFTQGSIVFAGASGVYSQNNSNLFWNNNTLRLGILTASPQAALDVGGDVLLSAATANLYLKDTSTGFQASTSTVVNLQPSNAIRSTSYTSGLVGWSINALGSAEFENVDVRGAIHAGVLVYNALQVTAGTFGVFKSGGKLKTDVVVPSSPTYGTTTVNIDIVDQDGVSHAASQLFAVNDILQLRGPVSATATGNTWFKVSSVSDQTTFWRYVCLIMAGTNNVTYYAGMGVADYGQSGNGFIIQTADQANAPYIQMATHAATFSSADSSGTLVVTPQLRLGNLNGSYGYVSNLYGFAAGDVAGANILIDPVGGIRIRHGTTNKITLDAVTGNASFTGAITAASGTVGGWTIGATTLTGGSATLASSGNLTLGTSNDVLRGSADDATYRLWIGHATAASAPFRVTKAGAVTATSGAIGGFDLGADYIRDAANSFGLASTVTGGDDVRFWAGNTFANRATAPFRLTEAGALVATNATITGAITATSGSFTGAITASSGSITGPLTMSGASASIAIGTTPPTSALAGTGIWIDRNQITSLTSGVQTVQITSAGLRAVGTSALIAQNGNGTAGISIYTSNESLGVVESFLSNTLATGLATKVTLQAWDDVSGTSTRLTVFGGGYTGSENGQVRVFADNLPLLGMVIGANSDPTAMLDIVSNKFRLRTAKTPASATATGNQGDICWDASFVYICTATNTWRRAAHATW